MPDALQLFLHIICCQDLLDHAFDIQAVRIMARICFVRLRLDLSFNKVLVVIQVAVVRRHAEVLPHVFAAKALLSGHQRLIQLFAVAGADDTRAGVAEKLLHSLGQVADRAGVCFLDKQIAGVGVLEGKLHQLDRLVQVHKEAGHLRVGDGDRAARLDLVDEERDDRAAAAHDVAVAGHADHGATALDGNAGVGVDDMLHHGLGNAHSVNRVSGLVRREADDPLHARVDRRVKHVVRALDVRFHGLHGEELAARNLLERGRVEYVVDPGHSVGHGARVAHVADEELDLSRRVRILRLQLVAHVVLLFLVAGEDADLTDIGIQKVLQNGVAERPGPACNH